MIGFIFAAQYIDCVGTTGPRNPWATPTTSRIHIMVSKLSEPAMLFSGTKGLGWRIY